jgi:hypothetical protein
VWQGPVDSLGESCYLFQALFDDDVRSHVVNQGTGRLEQLAVELLFWKDCIASPDGGDMPRRFRRVRLMVAV